MRNYYLSVILIVLFAINTFPQGEASNWYFGYGAGIKFNTFNGTVTSVDDGRLSTNEGCTSMSDSEGLLLFYTDGTTIYNRNHEIMINGSGLRGDASSTQSAIAVPKPGNPSLFYVFTVDNGLNGTNYGLNYSIIDMSRNNGLGEVTTKNVNLLGFCSEKLTAVRKDCSDESFWVVTLSTESGSSPGLHNTFHAFEIGPNGVISNSVKSTFSMGTGGLGIEDSRGYLVLSPDGEKMASANAGSGLYIYDFDNTTGIVSNQKRLQVSLVADSPYGVAFSPNNELLYVHSSNDFFDNQNPSNDNNPANHVSVLTQFDLLATDIQSSAFVVDQRNLYRGGLQLGPDGRIYRAMSATYNQGLGYLGIINNPNERGENCNYINNGLNLSPNLSAQGLPPFIQSIFNTQVDIIQNGESTTSLILCEGEEYTLRIEEEIPNATYKWTKDGLPINNNNATELVVKTSGQYEVSINTNNGECPLSGKANVLVAAIPTATTTTLVQCDEGILGDGLSIFDLTQANTTISNGEPNKVLTFYENFSDAQANINPVNAENYQNKTNPQFLYVRVTDEPSGCYNFTDIQIRVSSTNSPDTTIEYCDDDGTEDGIHQFDLKIAEFEIESNLMGDYEITFYQTEEEAILEDNPISAEYSNVVPYQDFVYARVENENACYGISLVELVVHPLPSILEEEEIKYCLNYYPEPLEITSGLLRGNINDFTYEWSTGAITESIFIDEIGTYSVIVTNEFGCKKQRIITVTASNIATINDIKVVDVSSNNSITVIVSGEGDYEFALNNPDGPYQDENVFMDVAAGLHTIYIKDKNGCGISQDLVSVIGFPRFFTPNDDGRNDRWKVYGMSEDFQSESTIYIYDRYGKLLKELSPVGPGWDGTYHGEEMPSTDYWFSVLLEDGRLFKGHFSLVR